MDGVGRTNKPRAEANERAEIIGRRDEDEDDEDISDDEVRGARSVPCDEGGLSRTNRKQLHK